MIAIEKLSNQRWQVRPCIHDPLHLVEVLIENEKYSTKFHDHWVCIDRTDVRLVEVL